MKYPRSLWFSTRPIHLGGHLVRHLVHKETTPEHDKFDIGLCHDSHVQMDDKVVPLVSVTYFFYCCSKGCIHDLRPKSARHDYKL
jgi:hypothetical protein